MTGRARRLEDIVRGLREHGLRVAFAESCTGGRLAADLTTVSGSSDVFAGSAVCYEIEAKRRVLGVEGVTPATVVSLSTAVHMAYGALRLFDADVAVATTGWLDGVHFGQHPHAYWAMTLRERDLPSDNWGHLVFDEGSTRAANRELLVDKVFAALSSFAHFIPGGKALVEP